MKLRIAAVLLVAHAAVAAAGPISFTPPSRVPDAQTHFKHGTALFDAHDYANAAIEYAAAYELDPDAKWLLLDIAIARRKANACPEAIDAYDAFLAAGPPDDQVEKARDGEAECAQVLAQARRDEDAARAATEAKQAQEAREREAASAREAAAAQHQRDLDDQARRDRDRDAAAARGDDRAQVRTRELALGGSATGVAIVAGSLYLLARHDASASATASSLGDFDSDRAHAADFQTASQVAIGISGALAATTAIYYALERARPPHALAIAPTSSGAMLVLVGAL